MDRDLFLSFIRGKLTGKHYAQSLLRPCNTMRRPACPYWCPGRVLSWQAGFLVGFHEVMNNHNT